MSCLLAICGRYGDIMMAVPSIQRLSHLHHGDLDLLVASKYQDVSILLGELDVPVRRVCAETLMCPTRDRIVTGMFMASWSEDLLRRRYLGYDKYVNAAPNMAPRGAHMMSLIAYRCGVVPSLSKLPPVQFPEPPSPDGGLVVHLGSNDPARVVCLSEKPLDRPSTCIGLPSDPCPVWIDEDRRSDGFEDALDALRGASAVVGSDSLFTHVSCLMGIPTLCIHTSERGYSSYFREAYPTGVSMVAERGMADPIAVRTKLLHSSDKENSDARSDRQMREGMELHP